MTKPIEFTAAWSLFRKLEEGAEDNLEFPVPEIDEFYETVVAEIGTEGLLRGWALVATVLRQQLRDHASSCDCGSAAWMLREQLHHAGDA